MQITTGKRTLRLNGQILAGAIGLFAIGAVIAGLAVGLPMQARYDKLAKHDKQISGYFYRGVQAALVYEQTLSDDSDALDSCQSALADTNDAANQLNDALIDEHKAISVFFTRGGFQAGDTTEFFNAISDVYRSQSSAASTLLAADTDACLGYVQAGQ